MHLFNAYSLGNLTLLYDWLETTIGDFEYETPRREPEECSYYFERRGKGWRYKFIRTINYLDQYPNDFPKKTWLNKGGMLLCVHDYAVIEIDDDTDAVMFKLRWV
jgi:hypothetical protein